VATKPCTDCDATGDCYFEKCVDGWVGVNKCGVCKASMKCSTCGGTGEEHVTTSHD
jgi:hypothetical protein